MVVRPAGFKQATGMAIAWPADQAMGRSSSQTFSGIGNPANVS
jgi:hypothetical protein